MAIRRSDVKNVLSRRVLHAYKQPIDHLLDSSPLRKSGQNVSILSAREPTTRRPTHPVQTPPLHLSWPPFPVGLQSPMRLIGAVVATSPRSFPESLRPLVRRVRLACSQEVEGAHEGFEVTIRQCLEGERVVRASIQSRLPGPTTHQKLPNPHPTEPCR